MKPTTMSKQQNLNREFAALIATDNEKARPYDLVMALIQLGIITEKKVLRFMALHIYQREIKKTITDKCKKGNCALASYYTLEKVPISARTLWEIRKTGW